MRIFICFFSILVEKCYLQHPPNTNQLNNHFHNSLHQMNEFLEDVEEKLKKEREILEQVHYEDFTVPTGYMEYDVTDIWWSRMPGAAAITTLGTPKSSIPPGYLGIPLPTKNDTATISQFPPGAGDMPDYKQQKKLGVTVRGRGPTGRQGPPGQQGPPAGQWPPAPETTTQWTHPFQVPPETTPSPTKTTNLIFGELPTIRPATTLSPFRQQLEEEMEEHRAGYVTIFVMKLLELIARKPREQVVKLVRPLEPIFQDLSERRVLISLREPLYSTVMSTTRILGGMPGDVIKSEATMFYSVLKNRNLVMAPDMRAVFTYADTVFTDEQGERMFRALQDLDNFPGSGKSAQKVCKEVVDSVMEPYFRMSGTAKRQRLVDSLNRALQVRLAEPGRPGRRSLAGKFVNYAKLIRNIFHSRYGSDRRHRRKRRQRHPAHTARRHRHENNKIDRDNKQYSKTIKKHKKTHEQKRFNVINGKRSNTDGDDPSFRNEGDSNRTQKRPANRFLRKNVRSPDNSEERRFLVNVYDAVYHMPGAGAGAGRRAGPALGDLSSGTDHEAELKNNIYRYFGYNPEIQIKDMSAA